MVTGWRSLVHFFHLGVLTLSCTSYANPLLMMIKNKLFQDEYWMIKLIYCKDIENIGPTDVWPMLCMKGLSLIRWYVFYASLTTKPRWSCNPLNILTATCNLQDFDEDLFRWTVKYLTARSADLVIWYDILFCISDQYLDGWNNYKGSSMKNHREMSLEAPSSV